MATDEDFQGFFAQHYERLRRLGFLLTGDPAHAEALDAPVRGSPSATNVTRWAPCSMFESTRWPKLAAP